MKLFSIRNWNTLYENNRTRELKRLDWVPIPNKQDGDGYTLIMEQKDGAAIFGAWIACVQIASRCDNPAGRGVLMRDGATPHNSASLSRMSRIPAPIIDRMLLLLSGPDINWLEYREFESKCDNPAPTCDNPAIECLEGKGREGKEWKGTYSPESRVALHYLNEKTGRHFRETAENLGFIQARLSEPEVTISGIRQMIDRQCRRWLKTPQSEYLRPETLFNKTKFDSYYAAKDQPINNETASKPEPETIIEGNQRRMAERIAAGKI